ncbi:uncharacterized protein NP_0582A [Natronomonas pharaonis DSM 2160]|uniref:Uncharacterized protein n=1 Tax=Natronomonas pharaonis (strain ATCC 35678 / DSM 2160 / CIP 103997 / JCM 8858 / NBRC 14720 / NCIMB 2260 / Gabara) TaxID=348780 RepID=A0A1U7ETX6_NATPD|nr:hypothetical protein [Natronomonas pharaonis]CAI48382.1 uncharacterized protein NP_0582A [Natronomonas pharaonis DSM 2160]
METPTVDDWGEAVTLARSLGHDGRVRVPKAAEPTLPESVSLRHSNFPWSIHRGAVAVYRESERGDHLQIREYPACWEVSVDSYNPHYRPVSHAAVDIPAQMLLAMGALTPLDGYRWVFGDRLPPVFAPVSYSLSALGSASRLGKKLLPGVG